MSGSDRPGSVDVLGVRIDDVTYGEALARLHLAISERRPTMVTTPNPEFVMAAQRDPAFRHTLNGAGLNIPDGVGLLLAARLAGHPLREHVQGTDLVLMLAAESVPRGYRWFLLGGWGDLASRAATALQKRYPGLEIVGATPGSPLAADDDRTRAVIQAAGRVDVLLVAYGAPKQEHWLERNLEGLGIPVGLGVGGVFAYLAGDAPRAPRVVRQLHFEWLHRLITQPWRWRRQLALPQFAALAIARAVRERAHRGRL